MNDVDAALAPQPNTTLQGAPRKPVAPAGGPGGGFKKTVGVVALGVLLGLLLADASSERGRSPGEPGDRLKGDALPPSVPGEPEDQAVVDAVSKGWAADRAGIRSGDVVLFWTRGAESGPVRSPLELARVEIQQAPLGVVTLRGTRNGHGEAKEWVIPPGKWCLWSRPSLSATFLSLYRSGRSRIVAGDVAGGSGDWRAAVEAAVRQKDPLRASWLQARLGRELASVGRWTEAEEQLEGAVRRLEERRPTEAAQLLMEWLWREDSLPANLLGRGETCLRRAMALEPTESLAAARYLRSLGSLAMERGDFAAAEVHFRGAYTIERGLAPESTDLVWSLGGLAMAAGRRGDFVTAEEGLHQAFEIQEKIEPESLDLSSVEIRLGMIAAGKGDLATAEGHFQRALRPIQRLSPYGPELAVAQHYFGIVEILRGDLASAEDRLRRSLALWERLRPEGYDVAKNLNSLGDLAGKRGDFAASEEHYRRALAISERLANGSSGTSPSTVYYLNNLAALEKRRGNLAAADEYVRRVLEIQEQLNPESYDTAGTCYQRGLIAFERGNLVLAEELQNRGLALRERIAPGRLQISDNLQALGAIAFAQGDLAKSRGRFRRALAIREKLVPGTSRLAETLNHLGHIDRRQKHLHGAAEHFCRAADVLDQQRKKLGGTTEGKSAFAGATAEPYRDCVAGLIDIGRPQKAFHVLERGRARTFLDLMAARDLTWNADLPPDLDRERKQANAEYDRTQATLERLTPKRNQPEIDRLLIGLRDLRARQEEITAKVRKSSPRFAALQDPRPLDLAGARAVLDPGTVLLAWSIGKERSFLFVVRGHGSDPGFAVLPIPVGEQELKKRVETFRKLLLRLGPRQRALSEQARELYDILLRPAEPWIASSRRLLLSPDGPLHTLPFAALVRDGRWLAEQKPMHEVLSATVYADLVKSRRASAPAVPGELTAFGAPLYPLAPGKAQRTDPEVQAAVPKGLFLTSLPASGDEVRGIASLYPGARTFLGAAATEERAKAVPKGTRYLHFACHGLLDERFPLNSALALSIPEHPKEGEDNGLLQAWEIFESVRLDADLVTLSACDSALGQELGGEGLLGMTRAFQYAGARSVLASLWSVSDGATAELMKRFYANLRQGQSKDEALRQAQVAMIRSAKKELAHPYYWAAFRLSGDWR